MSGVVSPNGGEEASLFVFRHRRTPKRWNGPHPETCILNRRAGSIYPVIEILAQLKRLAKMSVFQVKEERVDG